MLLNRYGSAVLDSGAHGAIHATGALFTAAKPFQRFKRRTHGVQSSIEQAGRRTSWSRRALSINF
jgi:hypothetical protein